MEVKFAVLNCPWKFYVRNFVGENIMCEILVKGFILKIFLLCYDVQAKAPGSSVIVVGTHMDLVPRTEREEKARVWQEMVNWYNSNRAHSHLYPHVMGTCFVGIPHKGKVTGVHGPDSLADFIYDVAMKMEVPNGIYFHNTV